MYDTLPGLGIHFATPTMTAYPTPMMPAGVPLAPPPLAPAPPSPPPAPPPAPEAKVAAE
jgi:hypothetical protein